MYRCTLGQCCVVVIARPHTNREVVIHPCMTLASHTHVRTTIKSCIGNDAIEHLTHVSCAGPLSAISRAATARAYLSVMFSNRARSDCSSLSTSICTVMKKEYRQTFPSYSNSFSNAPCTKKWIDSRPRTSGLSDRGAAKGHAANNRKSQAECHHQLHSPTATAKPLETKLVSHRDLAHS